LLTTSTAKQKHMKQGSTKMTNSNLVVVQFLLPFVYSLILIPNIHFQLEKNENVNGLTGLILAGACLLLFLAWAYFLCTFFGYIQRKDAFVVASSTPAAQTQTNFHRRIHFILEELILALTTLSLSFLLIYKSTKESCIDRDEPFIYFTDLSCNAYGDSMIFHLDVAVFLMLIPVTCSILFKHERIFEIVLSWIVVMISLVISAILLASSHSIIIILVYFFFSSLLISDNYQFHTYSERMKLAIISDLRRNMEEELTAKDKQTKELIGNVAHDLKTVIEHYSFTLLFLFNVFYLLFLAFSIFHARSRVHPRLLFPV
jgi:hypothetical protein